MWTTPEPPSCTSADSSCGVTARRLCGATPTLAPASGRTACRHDSRMRAKPSTSLTKRRWRGAGAARGGSHDAAGELAWVGEGCAVRTVVQIVKLADVGEARLEHLGEAQRA